MEPTVIAAARDGDLAALRRLLGADPAAVGARGWMGETALHAAAASGAVEAVRMLIGAGAPARARRDNGDTALHRAATGEIAALLVRALRDVTPDQHNEFGQTPLHCARDREVTEVLLRCRAALSERDRFGRTALHGAPESKARVLLEAGAEIDPRDNHGQTPLHRAVHAADAEAVALLLAKGADPAVRDDNGRTPIHLARERGSTTLAASTVSLAEPDTVVDGRQSALRLGRDDGVAFSVAGHATLVRWRIGPVPRPEVIVPTEHIAFRDLAVHPHRPLIVVAPVGAPAELRGDDLATPGPLPGLGDVTALSFSPDGRRLAAATDDERVVLYDLATRRITAGAEAGERNDCVAFSPDGSMLATTCAFQAGAHVRLDRVTPEGGLEPVAVIEPIAGDEMPAAVFTPDGHRLVLWTGRDLLLTDTAGTVIWRRSFDGPRVASSRPGLSADGGTIVLGLGGVVLALAVKDGRHLSVRPIDGLTTTTAVTRSGTVVVATGQGLRVVES
ncbi:ankyrin repeat domain-containing protein [Paractinoplanes atraurantiacus]|uniref:Ankyrin repeat n=1 Tax=Paractinoplanes atraurantiacus TaxID=1036182 RepID=A0A285JRR7_9ACTN|nr:ankyrin repeat domain-containing protein [Actinoplanes atraurantiacus]SNY63004.1 Ankyrin repeat [Actinoplanes atraurantiacus]